MKKLNRVLLLALALPFVLYAGAIASAHAMNTTGNSVISTNTMSSTNNTISACSNTSVQPYTGGAGVARFFAMPDGSGVTITDTGAVIKQGQCGNAYREGWINPGNISNTNNYLDILPQMQPGATNPYINNVTASSKPNTTSFASVSSNASPLATTNATTFTSPTYVTLSPATTTAPTSTATNSPPTYTTPASSTTVPSAQQTTSTSYSAPASNGKGAVLPNTGPGSIFAVGTITTMLGTIGHFFYRSLRYRSL